MGNIEIKELMNSLYCGKFPINECLPFRFIDTPEIGRLPRKSLK